MNQEAKYELVKFNEAGLELEVTVGPKEETIWLTQSQMAILFGVDISRISRHIKNALSENEISYERNLRKTQIPNSDKLVYLYDLDVIIYINNNTSNLLTRDINTFNNQYGNLTVQYTTKVHDRYIIIDKTKLYHLGHSIKDYSKAFCVGKKIFSINKLDSYLINVLLSNI